MSIDDINKPNLNNLWLDNEKVALKQYYDENPSSLIPLFEKDLRDLGFNFYVDSQIIGFMPKHKKVILPIAIRYYQIAKALKKYNEQNYFIRFFHFKGFENLVPMLLEDFYSKETQELTRWFIADTLFQIRSFDFTKEYIDIISDKEFGHNRQMIILLLGKLKEESAIPVLIDLLEDEEVRLQAICALGEFKKEDFRHYFERFKDSKHPGWRKFSREALKKLNK